MRKSVLTKSVKETQKLASIVLKMLLEVRQRNQASVIGLSGNLGVGKTTLIQGIGQVLDIKEKIQSPTFVVMRSYSIRRQKNIPWQRFIHVDAYRIKKNKEIAPLGLKNILREEKNLIVVEWAEKIRFFLPRGTLWVEFKHKGKTHRHIIIRK